MVGRRREDADALVGDVRVADLLAWDGPPMALAGRPVGLDRVIRWSLPSDLLDPSPYLRGGELVLTSGISMTEVEAQRKFVAAVCGAGASAIGFALGVVTDEVPAPIIRTANALGVAVLRIPADVAFVEITQRLAAEQHRQEQEARERARVGAIIDMVRRGQASAVVLGAELDNADAVHIVVAPSTIRLPLPEGSVVGTVGADTVAIVPGTIGGLLSAPHDIDAVFGWSGPIAQERIAIALREAFAAAAIAPRLRRPAGPRDLATWEGLVHRLTPDQIAPFTEHVITPLRRYDARHRTQLLQTAEALCLKDGGVQAASADLFIHENTLRKRAARIEEITGLNPLNALDRAAFLVAVLGGT